MLSRQDKKQLVYFFSAIIWGTLIFYLSSLPNLDSGFPFFYDLILRKLAHIFVFFVLTYLVAKSLNNARRLHLWFIIIAIVYYSFIDEIHQANIITRHGNYLDILIDSVGIFLGILLLSNLDLFFAKYGGLVITNLFS